VKELGLWRDMLVALRDDPSPERRHATAEALTLRGLPSAAVLLAVACVANSVPESDVLAAPPRHEKPDLQAGTS